MAQQELWHVEATGGFSAETSGFRMVVRALKGTGREVRFLVLHQNDGLVLLGSGIKEGWRDAMAAAEQMVDRCSRSGLLPNDLRSP
jgi:hypothetical protein